MNTLIVAHIKELTKEADETFIRAIHYQRGSLFHALAMLRVRWLELKIELWSTLV